MNTKMTMPSVIIAAAVEFPARLLLALAGVLDIAAYISLVSIFVIHYFYYEQIFYKKWRQALFIIINTGSI